MNKPLPLLPSVLLCGTLLWPGLSAAATTVQPASAQIPAVRVAHPTLASILAVAHAGSRIVTVGDHGVILLSDDSGRSYRQAQVVPTQALLTSVCFVDGQQGWAAGHDGVILHTADGGEHWALQREDISHDNPLLSIWFKDTQHGLAVGQFGTAVQTADGGKTWASLAVETGEETDRHLNYIFGDGAPLLYVAGEAGRIYRSTDSGATWTTIQTSNPGSFWAGLQLRDGRLLAAGQRGHLFVSSDQGLSWSEIASGTQQSLTDIVQLADGHLLLTGLAGTTLTSSDDGHTFTLHARADRAPLTAAIDDGHGNALLFGATGPVSAEPASP